MIQLGRLRASLLAAVSTALFLVLGVSKSAFGTFEPCYDYEDWTKVVFGPDEHYHVVHGGDDPWVLYPEEDWDSDGSEYDIGAYSPADNGHTTLESGWTMSSFPNAHYRCE